MVIKLTKKEMVVKKKNYLLKFFCFIISCVLVIFLAVQSAVLILQARDIALEKYTEIKTSVLLNINHVINIKLGNAELSTEEIRVDNISIESLIEKVSNEQQIDPIVLKVLLKKESSGGNTKKFLYRFEPTVFNTRSKIDSKYDENERRMLASSHGVTQIMGYRAEPDCGVHWSELYDNYVALSCSAKIMKENLFRASKTISNPAQRLKEAYRMYNGTGPRAESYASDAMSIIGELLFDKTFKTESI